MSLTTLVLVTILMASAIPLHEAFASNVDGPKQKHIDKHEEKHGDKHKDKHSDKKEKIKEKKEKIKEKIKEKKEKIKEKLEKHKGKIIEKIKDKISEYKEKKSKKSSSHDDDDDRKERDDDDDRKERDDDRKENDENKRKGHDNHDYDSDGNDDKKNGKGHEAHRDDHDDDIPDDSNADENEQTPETPNNDDDEIIVEETNKPKMNKFKGSGNDFAPTLGSDRYGNNYVDNGFTFNDFVTDVEGFKTHMPLQTLQVGEPNKVVLKIYDNRGAAKIEHVELAFGLDYDEYASQSTQTIVWKQNFKGEQVTFEKDPENVLMDVSATGVPDGKIMEIEFSFAFREPMEKSKIGLVVWDQEKHSRTVYFNDGIEVVGESLNPPEVITILDEKGYPVTITMTGENEGIDEEGNIWTHNSPWKKQTVNSQIVLEPESVGSGGFDRAHSMFDSYKSSQADAAQQKLLEILGGSSIYNFSD